MCDLTHGADVIARQQGVDLGHHPIPVEKHVEGDHRRDDEERKHVDKRPPAGPDRRQQRAEEPRPLGENCAKVLLDRHGRLADEASQPAILARQKDGLEARHVVRQALYELRGLPHQHGDDAKQGRGEQEEERHKDDECRAEAREPLALEPVGDWIEEIGQRHAGEERQEDRAEHVEHEDEQQESAEPEQGLAAQLVVVGGAHASGPVRH